MIYFLKKKLFNTKKDTQSSDALRKQGAHIGNHFNNYGTVDYGHAYLFTAGEHVTIAKDAIILLHDASTQFEFGHSRIGRVVLGDKVFIGARSIILPDITIGSNCIIGAGSVVTKDIPPNSVAVGNPARVIGTYADFVEKNRKLMDTAPVFDSYWKNKTAEEKQAEYALLKDGGIGFDK